MFRCLLKTQLRTLVLFRKQPSQTIASIQFCHTKTASAATVPDIVTASKDLHNLPVSENTEENSEADDNRARKLKILQLEVSVLRQEGRKSPDPDRLTKDHWDRLLSLPTKSARYRYYTFLWSIEKKKENIKVRMS